MERRVSFEFLRNGVLFLEDTRSSPSTFYKLHVGNDLSLTQTFNQEGLAKRTLHAKTALFEGSSIHSANPAEFSFTLLMIDEASLHQHIPIQFGLNYNNSGTLDTFSLYYVNTANTPDVQYKIEKCVITGITFTIPRAGFILASITGQGSRLIRSTGTYTYSDAGYTESVNLTFAVSKEFKVLVDSQDLPHILGASLELQNNITWVENATIHATRNAVDASSSIYPTQFVLSDRSLGGSIQQYVAQSSAQANTNILTWKENIPISIRAGLSSSNYQLQANLTGCSFTNRPAFGEVLTQSYDFRLMSNPSNLSSLFTY